MKRALVSTKHALYYKTVETIVYLWKYGLILHPKSNVFFAYCQIHHTVQPKLVADVQDEYFTFFY